MCRDCVVDTSVLRKANAPLEANPRSRAETRRRLALLKMITDGEVRVLISGQLLREYDAQVLEPRNDYVQQFLTLLVNPSGHILNWARLSGSERDYAFGTCRFPREDEHVLRTAVRRGTRRFTRSTIYTEEDRMLRTNACIKRKFRIAVDDPRVEIQPLDGDLADK